MVCCLVIDETYHGANSELRELPAVELSTLPLILKVRVFDFSFINLNLLVSFSDNFVMKRVRLYGLCF